MTKNHQERPHRICESLPILSQDKIQKHHDLKRCPMCRYRHKRSTQFNEHLKKARGLRATAEARRAEKKNKKAAALADCLEKLATADAPAPLTPPMYQVPSFSIAQPHHDPTRLTPNTNTSLSPTRSVKLPPMSSPAIQYTQEPESISELPLNEEQGSRQLSDTLSYTLPPTPTSSGYMNLVESPGDDNDRTPRSSSSQDKPSEEESLKPSFLPKDLDLDWDYDWDLGFSQYTRFGMRVAFESNQGLYNASLAYLLSLDSLPY